MKVHHHLLIHMYDRIFIVLYLNASGQHMDPTDFHCMDKKQQQH